MNKILILFAHPALEKSRVHIRMLHYLQQLKGVTVNDLYELYPDFDIDVTREQKQLMQHDIIILQHPFYWYSAPAMVKQWLDLVLEHGWAYGSKGVALAGKKMMSAISCGGSKVAYQPDGINQLTIPAFLSPFRQTAALCKVEYLPPFVIHSTHKLSDEAIDSYAQEYKQVISLLQAGGDVLENAGSVEYMNDLITSPQLIL